MMNYIIAGILFAIGWHIVKIIYEISAELIFCKLHRTKWYNVMAGKEKKLNSKSDKGPKMKIGF